MVDHQPKIGTGSESNRVKEERNATFGSAGLFTRRGRARESDNDFHLIVGRDPQNTPEMYITMELSGLPTANSASFKKLKSAPRDAFKNFFAENLGGDLPGQKYDFYDPPISVKNIQGSLFFDMSHATGTRPGPKSLKSRYARHLGSASHHKDGL